MPDGADHVHFGKMTASDSLDITSSICLVARRIEPDRVHFFSSASVVDAICRTSVVDAEALPDPEQLPYKFTAQMYNTPVPFNSK